MNASIRKLLYDDLPQALPLYGQLGMDDGAVLALSEAQKIYRRMNGYPDYRLYCAESGSVLIGVFSLLIMDNLGHTGKPSAVLEDIIVDRRWRGRGIGRQMVAYAMQKSREYGCYKLSLSSNRNRTDAHRFYEKLGFKKHGFSFAVFSEEMKAFET
jgi:ribosomal protein S18 acetylase RimI-like enzyme